MPDELEVGDRAPNFELPACYGYKAGASSPSAEEKVKVSLKDFESIAFKANCFLAVAGYSQTLTS